MENKVPVLSVEPPSDTLMPETLMFRKEIFRLSAAHLNYHFQMGSLFHLFTVLQTRNFLNST